MVAPEEQEPTEERPRVGLGLLVCREIDEKTHFMLGKRQGAHWPGHYQGPGGHQRVGETFVQCVLRELEQEAGPVEVIDVTEICLINLYLSRPHYIDLGYRGTWVRGEPIVKEPEKNESWGWYPHDDLPEPLMPGMRHYIDAWRLGRFMVFEETYGLR